MSKSEKPTSPASLEFHPHACDFPLMEGKEFKELVADIEKNGLRDPIILFGGQILDGRYRYRACLEAGVKLDTLKGENFVGDPKAYTKSH
jgi:hypothetical protein